VGIKDFADTRPVGLYESAIGQKSLDYYLSKFEVFDDKGPGLHFSWNWAALLFTGLWALYRKMYVWFVAWVFILVFFGVAGRAALTSQAGSFWVLVANLTTVVCFAAFANSLYHAKVKARIYAAQKANTEAARVNRRLDKGSGVHKWVPNALGAIPVIGILAAVALPAYQDYTKRQVSGTSQPVTQQIPSPNLKPFTGALDAVKKPDLTWTPEDHVSEDRKILKEQGIGGNQSLADVEAWANSQLAARFLNPAELQKAHDFALMWQRQLIQKMKYSSEYSHYLGTTFVVDYYDQKKGICRPDMSINGGVEDMGDDKIKVSPECYVRHNPYGQ
jgi:hypothetical protein